MSRPGGISVRGRHQCGGRVCAAVRSFAESVLREAKKNGIVEPETAEEDFKAKLWHSNGLKIAIVGGGLAGLAAAMKIAEAGHEVDLISVVPVKRSHSVCAQGGINGAVNTKGEGDSPAKAS